MDTTYPHEKRQATGMTQAPRPLLAWEATGNTPGAAYNRRLRADPMAAIRGQIDRFGRPGIGIRVDSSAGTSSGVGD